MATLGRESWSDEKYYSLSAAEKELYDTFSLYVENKYKNHHLYPQIKADLFTRKSLIRYLRSKDWNMREVKKQMNTSIDVKEKYSFYKDSEYHYQKAGNVFETNFITFMGKDKDDRIVIAFKPKHFYANEQGETDVWGKDALVHSLIYVAHLVVQIQDDYIGTRNILIMCDCSDISVFHMMKYSSDLKVIGTLLNNTLPDMVFRNVIYNAPWAFRSLFALAKMVLDPISIAKIVFIKTRKEFRQYIGIKDLEIDYKGKHTPYPSIADIFHDWRHIDAIYLPEGHTTTNVIEDTTVFTNHTHNPILSLSPISSLSPETITIKQHL